FLPAQGETQSRPGAGRRAVTDNLTLGGDFSMTTTGDIWVTLDRGGTLESEPVVQGAAVGV
ncbi:MAG: hypothetical protein LKG23_14655, partial [Nitrospira sp.]|nr:hypothetical protein [Nitrospira sp.]